MKNTVFVPVEITDEILDGLDEKKNYFALNLDDNEAKYRTGRYIKVNDDYYDIILLPVSITEEEILKAAEDYAEKENSAYDNDYFGFKAGINYLLNKAK